MSDEPSRTPEDGAADAAPAPTGGSARSLKHELRTPLNHILGYCEMLLEEAADGQKQAFVADLERIHAAGKRLLSVINDLFDTSKPAPQKLDQGLLHHELRTPLNQIIGYAEMLQEDARDLGCASFVPDLERIGAAARTLLDLVVARLGSEHLQVQHNQVAEPAAATTFIRRDGTGGQPRFLSGHVAMATGRTGALLVVDDDELNRDMLARRLVRLGYRVAQAANGRQALDRIRSESFDLVLLDILMPEMNGYQVLEEMSADPILRGVPVIVLSASDDTAGVARCIEMGAEDYLSKPFDPILLQARISASLEKKRLRDQEVSYLRQIEEEKQRSDTLLRIILPHDVAEELKRTSMVRPRRLDRVGVLFCDIVGFTSYCDQNPPERILTHLQSLVESFETLTARHQLEKIKTIGDSFMAVAGLLVPLANPAWNCVRCALEMITVARMLPPQWEVRVGVHLGPVIAGVVGKKKYQYDVWGDTVNIAARMEQVAAPGAVCVSSETWAWLAPHCRGRSKGIITIKGKGELEVYQVDEVLTPPTQ